MNQSQLNAGHNNLILTNIVGFVFTELNMEDRLAIIADEDDLSSDYDDHKPANTLNTHIVARLIAKPAIISYSNKLIDNQELLQQISKCGHAIISSLTDLAANPKIAEEIISLIAERGFHSSSVHVSIKKVPGLSLRKLNASIAVISLIINCNHKFCVNLQ